MGSGYSKSYLKMIWCKAIILENHDPQKIRTDKYGNKINFKYFNKKKPTGWYLKPPKNTDISDMDNILIFLDGAIPVNINHVKDKNKKFYFTKLFDN